MVRWFAPPLNSPYLAISHVGPLVGPSHSNFYDILRKYKATPAQHHVTGNALFTDFLSKRVPPQTIFPVNILFSLLYLKNFSCQPFNCFSVVLIGVACLFMSDIVFSLRMELKDGVLVLYYDIRDELVLRLFRVSS